LYINDNFLKEYSGSILRIEVIIVRIMPLQGVKEKNYSADEGQENANEENTLLLKGDICHKNVK
jgi:hypothetical protein